MTETSNFESAYADYQNTIASYREKFDEIKNFNREQTKGAAAFSLVADPLGAHLLTTYGGDAVANLKNYLGEKTQGIRDLVENKIDSIKQRVGQAVQDRFDQTKQAVMDRASGVKQEVTDRVQGLQDEVQGRVADIQSPMGDSLPGMEGATELQDVTAFGTNVAGQAEGLAGEVTARAGALVQEVGSRAQGLLQEGAQAVSNLGNEATSALGAARTEAVGFFSDLRNEVMNVGRSIFNDVKGQIATRATAVSDEVASRAAGAGDLVSSLPNNVVPEIAARASNLPSMPSDLVQSINARLQIPIPEMAPEIDVSQFAPLQAARQIGETILPDVRQAVSNIPEINMPFGPQTEAEEFSSGLDQIAKLPATNAVPGLPETNLLPTDAASATKAAQGLAEGGEAVAETAAKAVGEGVGVGLTEAGEITEGVLGDTGVGAIVGGLLAVGGILASVFGHHNEKPPPPPNISAPQFQAGLSPQ